MAETACFSESSSFRAACTVVAAMLPAAVLAMSVAVIPVGLLITGAVSVLLSSVSVPVSVAYPLDGTNAACHDVVPMSYTRMPLVAVFL